MELKWPLLVVILPAAVVVLVAWWSRRPRARPRLDALRMAHVARLRGLPRYRRLRRRRVVWSAWLALGALAACSGAILLAARPQHTRVERTERSRDVMLCLDASYSMNPYNERVVQQVQRVLGDLDGVRVGLTIYSGAALSLVPLTDDLDFVGRELAKAEHAFLTGGIYVAGIDLDSDQRASLLGDGLVSCAQRFDRLDEDRARSIIVTSDNDPLGQGVYSVRQGAAYASERDIVVRAIASPSTAAGARTQEFEDAAIATGGTYAVLDDDGTAAQLVDRIEGQDSRRVQGPPREIVTESTGAGRAITALGVGILATGWLAQTAGARPRRLR